MVPNSSQSPQSNPNEKPQPELQEEEIRQDIFRGREFTLADFIAQEGSSFMKGESPVPRMVQLKTEIKTFISRNLPDVSGALHAILHRWVEEDIARISQNLDTPLQALLELLESIVNNPPTLHELVRQVDMKWGSMNGERPHFQRPGQCAHPDDEYTHQSVDQQLRELIEVLKSQLESQS